MNTVQLYNYIGKIATSIPIVHSYYTQSVYECWNNTEVKYGSFVIAVKNISTQQNTTAYNCVVYYGDRLSEDRSNCTSIQTDAVNVIQSVVGAIKRSENNIEINYPVQCTLFEQQFADDLAGAYANLTIISEGIGECGFEGIETPTFPEYSGGQNVLDNYYTKDQVDQLDNELENSIKKYVDEQTEDIDVDLTGYATEQWVEEKKYLQIQPNNEIWYTSRLGEVIYPVEENFGANIVSNTYDAEKECWVITFDSDVTQIGNNVFKNCTNLTSIKIPNSVTSISGAAFRNCSSLTSIEIPDNVTSIGIFAFSGCTSLTSIKIPDSVTSIGVYVFEGCSSLTSIKIPNRVTKIGEGAFFSCTNLTSIKIADSVTEIGGSAFYDCTSLKEVNCKPTTPPTIQGNTLPAATSGCKFYVPINSVDAYKTADYWSNYANFIIGCVFEDEHLVSGVNIKTINGESILGSGNIEIEGGSTDLTNYYTKEEIDGKIGDIDSILNSLLNDI